MNWWQSIFGSWGNLPKTFRHFGLREFGAATSFETLTSYAMKYQAVFTNPAMLKVIALQCGTFSLGQFYVYDKENTTLTDDPFLAFIRKPNLFQYQQQYLWEYMFRKMLGTAYVYIDRDDLTPSLNGMGNVMQMLDPAKLELPKLLHDAKDKIITSKATFDDIMKSKVTYTYADGNKYTFEYGKLLFIPDMPLSDNHFSSRSRIDALYKVIANVNASLDSLNINTRYAGKFLVAGMQDPNDVTRLPLSNDEKKDIEQKVDTDKPVEAVKSMIEIRRFVENAGNQKLDGVYLNQYYIIGSMYNIPKDVLEAFNSGTYENQEKARGAHVSYSLQPDGDLLATALGDRFGYTEQGKTIAMDWEHLPFMQVFAEQRARAKYVQTQSLEKLLKVGVNIDSINAYLDTEFELNDTEDGQGEETNPGAGQGNQTGTGEQDGNDNNQNTEP